MGISKTKRKKEPKNEHIKLLVFITHVTKAVPRTYTYQRDEDQTKMVISNLSTQAQGPLERSARASKCAIKYNGLCIPPCWRYAGRSRRRCNYQNLPIKFLS